MADLSILLLDTEPRTHNRYLVLAIADALRRHPAVGRVRVAGHGEALATFTEERHDTLIAFGGANTHAALVGRLAGLAATSVLWTTEDPYERAANVRGSTGFDLVFTNDRSSLAAYGGRARHLPLAASPLFHDFPVIGEDRGYLYDVLFVGTAWPNRVETLNALMPRLPEGLKVKLALPWNAFIGPPGLDDAALVTDWRCGNRDFARLANRSRVVLTLPRAFSAARDGQASGSTPPPRLFETALAGGYQVMVSPEPETAAYYAPGAEVALCADEGAAAEAIAAALARPDRRITAARAAQERTRAEHLYDHRVADIVGAVLAHRHDAAPRHERPAPVRTVLMLTHNRAGRRPGGGVEVYQEVLTGLGEGWRVLFLFPDFADGGWSLHLEGPGVAESYACGAVGPPLLTEPRVEALFERILFEERVDLVHVHHLLHLPLSLPLIARACGVPVVHHLHDHHLICERWLLLDQTGRFCDVVNRGPDQCDACLSATGNHPPGAKSRRDGFAARVVDAVDAFVTSTPGTGAYLRGFFPEIPAERIVEIEMATPDGAAASPAILAPAPRPPVAAPPETGIPPLTVAVLGNFAGHKGGDDLIALIRTCRTYPIRFRILGRVDEHHAGLLADLPREQVAVTGAYEQHAVSGLLAGCDVSLHLSIWPETYVIALTEAWRAGLVPVVTDIGALAERVTDGLDGFKVPPHAPGAVRARLLDLHYDRDRLARMRAAVARKRFGAVEPHLAALRVLYERLIAARPCPHARLPVRDRSGYNLRLEDLGIRVNAPSWTDSAIRWDEADAAPAATVRPAARLASAVAQAQRRLPVSVLPRAGTRWSLDVLRVDDCDVEPGLPLLARRSLFVRGWLRVPSPAPLTLYLRLSGASGTVWAPIEAERRPDVAEWLGDPAAAGSGFSGRIDLDGLAFGPHAVALAAAGDRALHVLEGLPPIFSVAEGADPTRFAPDPRPVLPGVSGAVAVRHSLPEAGGSILAASDAVWAFEAEGDALRDAVSGMPVALLRDAAGRAWSASATPWGERGLRFVARLPGIEPGAGVGPCTLVLADRGPRGLRPLTRPLAVEMVPTGQRFRSVDRLPDGFSVRFPRKERRAPTLEAVSRGADDAGRVVRCRGWAFVPGLGPPLSALVLWREEGISARIAANLSRPDIAADSGSEAALHCGFDLAIPEAALTAGRVRFLQRYRRRTVEFTQFGEALRRAAALG